MHKISNYARPRARIPELICKTALRMLHAGFAASSSSQQSRCQAPLGAAGGRDPVESATGGGES